MTVWRGCWKHDGRRYFDGEVAPRINGRTIEAGADVLRALDYSRERGARMAEAVAVVRAKRGPDGRWPVDRIHPGRVHFRPAGEGGEPSRWNTLRALRVLARWDSRAA